MVCGPAGENLVRYANVMTGIKNSGGRTGMGCVRGSKNLKAVACTGTMDIKIAHPVEALEFNKRFIEQITSAKVNQTQGTIGTPFIWGATNSWRGIRCRNFQYNQCEYADDIEPEHLDEIATETIGPYHARERGTSVYSPNRVLPMLPEALSNGLCSLKPDEDRLCLCCELRVGEDGRITRSRFFEGVMRSVARLTYRDVGAFLDTPSARHAPKFERLRERLLALHGVYKSFIRARSGRGTLELDTPELKLKFDEQGKVAALVEDPRNDAHRLIEECMIAANVAAARFLDRYKVPTLYRVHGLPELDRLETLRTFLREFGLWLPAPAEVTPDHLRDLLQKIGDRPDAGLISTAVIRTMPQAVYQPGNIGHFGLALEHYAHFTSPIRRYPDLVVHRGIRQVARA